MSRRWIPLVAAATVMLAVASPAAAEPSPAPLILRAEARPTADLIPGGRGAAQFSISNANPFSVQLRAIDFGLVRSSSPVQCPASVLVADDRSLTGITVAADAVDVPVRVPDALRLASSAPSGCQGVVFTIEATIQATSEATRPSIADTGAPAAGTWLAGSVFLLCLGIAFLRASKRRLR